MGTGRNGVIQQNDEEACGSKKQKGKGEWERTRKKEGGCDERSLSLFQLPPPAPPPSRRLRGPLLSCCTVLRFSQSTSSAVGGACASGVACASCATGVFFFFLTKEVESVESGEFAFFFPSHRSSSREKGEKSDAMNPEHARNPSLFFLHASLGGEHM